MVMSLKSPGGWKMANQPEDEERMAQRAMPENRALEASLRTKPAKRESRVSIASTQEGRHRGTHGLQIEQLARERAVSFVGSIRDEPNKATLRSRSKTIRFA
jgi:hypothetical protein